MGVIDDKLAPAPRVEPGADLYPRFQSRRLGRGLSQHHKQTHEIIRLAFEGIGGLPALIEWAKNNKETFYTRIWAPQARTIAAAVKVGDAGGGYQFALGVEITEGAESEELAQAVAEIRRDPDGLAVGGVVSGALFTESEAPVPDATLEPLEPGIGDLEPGDPSPGTSRP